MNYEVCPICGGEWGEERLALHADNHLNCSKCTMIYYYNSDMFSYVFNNYIVHWLTNNTSKLSFMDENKNFVEIDLPHVPFDSVEDLVKLYMVFG